MTQPEHLKLLEDADDGFPVSLHGLNQRPWQYALFSHAARLYPFAAAYLHHQIEALVNQDTKQLHTLAKCCQYLAAFRHDPAQLHQALRRLHSRAVFSQAVEYISRAFINDRALRVLRQALVNHPDAATLDSAELVREWQLPYPIQRHTQPVPASLMLALLQWPQHDNLLPKVISRIQALPALSDALSRQATLYTPQGKTLDVKSALLLLGPQRSRELVLLAHFETSLIQPVFPLRQDLLERRRLIVQCLYLFEQRYGVVWPVRRELLGYLLIYDAWRAPAWAKAVSWQPSRQRNLCTLDSWLGFAPRHQHRVASRLVKYWQLPAELSKLMRLQHSDKQLNAALALSIASVSVLNAGIDIQQVNAHHSKASQLLAGLYRSLAPGLSPEDALSSFLALCQQAACAAGSHSQLPAKVRP